MNAEAWKRHDDGSLQREVEVVGQYILAIIEPRHEGRVSDSEFYWWNWSVEIRRRDDPGIWEPIVGDAVSWESEEQAMKLAEAIVDILERGLQFDAAELGEALRLEDRYTTHVEMMARLCSEPLSRRDFIEKG